MVLVAESALKRIYPGWHIPYVEWHRARRVDNGCDDPYFDIPQHAVTVRVAQLSPDEVVDIAALTAERDALKAECERLKLDQWPCPRCGPSEQDPLRSQLAALREALRRACDGWEGCWTSDNNDPPPDEIAELRKLAEES